MSDFRSKTLADSAQLPGQADWLRGRARLRFLALDRSQSIELIGTLDRLVPTMLSRDLGIGLSRTFEHVEIGPQMGLKVHGTINTVSNVSI